MRDKLTCNQEQQPKGNTFINSIISLAKGASLRIVLDLRYINSPIDKINLQLADRANTSNYHKDQ